MPVPSVYPEKLKKRVHQLYYVEGMPMGKVLPILKKEFPKLAKRMTTDRIHSVARIHRQGLDLPPKHRNIANGKKRNKTALSLNGKRRKEIIEAARKLKQKNYRWQAVVDELKLQFPNENIPPAGPLANIIKGRKPKDGNKQYHVAITGPSGVVLNIDVNSNKSLEQIIRHILEV